MLIVRLIGNSVIPWCSVLGCPKKFCWHRIVGKTLHVGPTKFLSAVCQSGRWVWLTRQKNHVHSSRVCWHSHISTAIAASLSELQWWCHSIHYHACSNTTCTRTTHVKIHKQGCTASCKPPCRHHADLSWCGSVCSFGVLMKVPSFRL